MKKIIFAAALILGCLSFKASDAQFRINLNLNIGNQPEWGPVGYDHAEYYYFPDIDAYYSVPQHQFVYFQGGQWIFSPALPGQYRNFDLYHSYKVVLNQPQPWRNAASIRAKYAGFRGHHDQVVIRDSHDVKYRNHWNGGGHDNGNHNGPGNRPGDHGQGGDRGGRDDHDHH